MSKVTWVSQLSFCTCFGYFGQYGTKRNYLISSGSLKEAKTGIVSTANAALTESFTKNFASANAS